mgnify:CR=1 FL=1
MIIDEFYINVELYKEGNFEEIAFYDHFQKSVVRFHPKQVEALRYLNDNICTSIGYGGAARGGKSLLLTAAPLFESYAYDGTRYLLGRKDLQQFWGTTFKTLKRTMDNFGFTSKDYHFNRVKNEIVFYEPKSELIFRNLELQPRDKDATAFGSLELTKAFIDQSENVHYKIIEKVTERVGSHGCLKHGIKGKAMEAFNPLKTHVHKRFWQMFKNKIDNPSIKFVRALPTDNPSSEAKKWVEDKKKDHANGIMTDKEYKKQILGNFDYADDEDAIIKFDAIIDYWNGSHVKGSGEIFLTLDPAGLGKDKAVFRVWNGWKVIARFVLYKCEAPELIEKAKAIQKRYGIINSNTVIDANGMGEPIAGILRACKFYNNARPIKKEGYEHLFDNLKSQCSILMGQKINKREVAEVCHVQSVEIETTEEMEQVRIKDLDSDGKQALVKKDEVKKNINRSPDEWDSIMMRFYFELRSKMWWSGVDE